MFVNKTFHNILHYDLSFENMASGNDLCLLARGGFTVRRMAISSPWFWYKSPHGVVVSVGKGESPGAAQTR